MRYAVVLLLMFAALSAGAQEVPPQVPDLTQADMVDILVDYNLVHEGQYAFGADKYYGLTETGRHLIHIFDVGSRGDKRDTVIHEMLHIRCNDLHIECTDEAIEAKSTAIYNQLFLR